MTRPDKKVLLQYGAVIFAGLLLVVLATVVTRTAPEAAANRTLNEASVVATLRTDGRSYSDALQAALRAARLNPNDLTIAKAAARILIDDGRDAGDSRLVGAALGVLRPFMADADAQTLYLAATARQYQHDFPGALALLDKAAQLDPTDVNIILTRATIQIVLGRFDLAERDCDRLFALSRADLGFLCQATSRLLTADAPLFGQRLEAILGQSGLLDPALHGWARSLLGEVAALQGNKAEARDHFAAVLANDPLALRERLILADLLLADGLATEALTVLEPAIPADGVLIRRVLAARITGENEAADAAELAARFKLNIDLGLTAHAREETMYFLQVERDPVMALERALVNWNLQREIEDAQLLIDAAMFAGKPEAAAPVIRWMAEQSVVAPSLRIPDAIREAAQ